MRDQVREPVAVTGGRRQKWLRLGRLVAFGVVGLLVAQSCATQTDTLEGVAPDVAYVYDSVGRLRGVSVPDGETAVYSYDAVGNVVGVERYPSDEVSVVEVSPARAAPGTEVVIHGTGFDRKAGRNTVIFGGVEAEVVEANEVELSAVVPEGAESGVVEVSSPGGSASSEGKLVVEVDRTPVVTEVSPPVVAAGGEVTIRGENFTGDELLDHVMIGGGSRGVYGTVVSASETELVATVPRTAGSGRVSVATPYGTGEGEGSLLVVPPVERPSSTLQSTDPADTSGRPLELLEPGDVGDWVRAELGESDELEIAAGAVGLVSFEGRARSRVLVDLREKGQAAAGSGCSGLELGLVGPGGVVPPDRTDFASLCGDLDEARGDADEDEDEGGDEDDDLNGALDGDADPAAEAAVGEEDEPGFGLPWDGVYTLVVEPREGRDGSLSVEVGEVGTLSAPERLDDEELQDRLDAEAEATDLQEESGVTDRGPRAPPGGLVDGLERFPVDLSNGLLQQSESDLVVDDVMELALDRSYRPVQGAVTAEQEKGGFGIGSSLEFAMELETSQAYQTANLVLPDGLTIPYRRVSDGVDWQGALFEHRGTPTVFFGSTIVWNGWGWDLVLEDGTTLTFVDGVLVALDDGFGNRLMVERHADRDYRGYLRTGDVVSVSSPSGRWVSFEYDDDGRVVEATSYLGDSLTYSYTPFTGTGSLADQINVDVGGYALVDAVEYRSADGEKLGEVVYDYDEENRLASIGDADGDVIRVGYDDGGRVTSQWLAPGLRFEFDYTTATRTIEHPQEGRDPVELEVVTEVEVTDPAGGVRRVAFDENGHWESDAWAVGTDDEATLTAERDAESGFVTTLEDADGQRSTYGYDEAGYLVSAVDAEGSDTAAETGFEYDRDLAELLSITDPGGYTSGFGYDEDTGALTSETYPGGAEVGFAYDSRGRVTRFTDVAGEVTEVDYEGVHQVTVTDATGARSRDFYDAAGRLAAVTDPVGDTTEYGYDREGRLVSVADAAGAEIEFAYDDNGSLASVTDEAGNTTGYEYDAAGRLVEWTDPAGNADSYTYDEGGRLETHADRRGVRTSYSYDDAGRLASVAYGATDDGEESAAESRVDYSYDDAGRLVEVDDSTYGTISFAYDDLGQLVSETGPEGEVRYSYDATGRRTGMVLPDGTETVYDYDDTGLLTSVTQDGQSGEVATEAEAEWDDTGQLTGLDLPNDVGVDYTYDQRRLLRRIDYGDGLGAVHYDYDPAGQRVGASGDLAEAVELPDPVADAGHGPGNELTAWDGAELVYDEAGNLVDDGTNTYTWNARGELVAINGDTEAAFEYDPFGRRVETTVDGTTTSYLHDGQNIAQQAGDDGTFTYLSGLGLDEIYARTDESGNVTTYLTDVQGSVLGLVDEGGDVATSYTYTPYGAATVGGEEGDPNPFGFTGREHDPTGLHYYRARYYHPELGRFISEDPLGFDAGDTNLYAYTFGDPVNFVDPTGQQAGPAVAADLGVCFSIAIDIIGDTGPTDTIYDALEDRAAGRISEEEHHLIIDRVLRELDEAMNNLLMACGGVALGFIPLGPLLRPGMNAFGRGVQKVAQRFPNAAKRFPNLRPRAGNTPTPTPPRPHGPRPTGTAGVPPGGSGTSRPGAGALCSFDGDTEVLMADGTTRPIDEVEPGDWVQTRDQETGQQGPRRVTHAWLHEDTLVDLETTDGDVVTTTDDHPFWNHTDQQWQPAEDLDPGDVLLTAEGRPIEVQGLDPNSARDGPAYNLTVTDPHTYYVQLGEDEVLTHNNCGRTRQGVPRNNPSEWRQLRDSWDKGGYGDILSSANRQRIAQGRVPRVDETWIQHFPGDRSLQGEVISMHHIGGGPMTVPLPRSRHLDAHRPGGTRFNPGGPGETG